jgi:hypothetical protein
MPKTAPQKIWLYLNNFEFKSFSNNDPRLDFIGAPKGMVRFTSRKNPPKFQYCYWGLTGAKAAEKANQPVLERIRKLESLIENERRLLVNPPPKSG